MNVTAFLDANVLYPAITRSVLLELARKKTFRSLWSEQVHQEWTGALLRNKPELNPARIARTRSLMELHVNDAMVAGYEALIPTLTLPDPNDRHVLAAAIHGGATIIVTANLKHFPAATLVQHGITVVHPDEFIRGLLDTAAQAVIEAFTADRARMIKPPMTVSEYLVALENAGLTVTAATLRDIGAKI